MTTEQVTRRNSPPSSGGLEDAPSGRSAGETSPKVSTLHFTPPTGRDRAAALFGRSRAYWVPPNLLTAPPASVAELAAYAGRAGWTSSTDGLLRRLGVAWFTVVGLPTTVLCRYVEWVAQRPGRALPAFLLWQVFIHSDGPALWAVDNLIRPVLAAAAWTFLP